MLEVGTLLRGRYNIVCQVGKGGMGTVFLAKDENLGITVAVKQNFFDEQRLIEAFKREARLLAGLRHTALPQVKDYFIEGEGQYLVMEYIAGDDLGTVLQNHIKGITPGDDTKPFNVHDVVRWAEQLLDALDYLHTRSEPIVHRDIKPQNLKLAERNQIILLDFGLAKGKPLWMTRVTTTGSLYGYTPNYAPIEQIRGLGTDPRSDLYALGATLYHLLTGVPPIDSATRADSFLGSEPDPLLPVNHLNPKVPYGITAALMKAMEPHRNNRFSSAAAMLEALRDAKGSTVVDWHARKDQEALTSDETRQDEKAWPTTELRIREQAEQEQRLAEEARQAQEEEERRARKEAERIREQRESARREQSERKEREEEERKALEEAERLRLERKRELEARQRQQKEEQELKAKEDAEGTRREEQERKAREEAELLRLQRAQELQAQREAERKQQEEDDRKAKETAERQRREEEERRAQELAESLRLEQAKAEREATDAEARRQREEAEQRVRDEPDRQQREEERAALVSAQEHLHQAEERKARAEESLRLRKPLRRLPRFAVLFLLLPLLSSILSRLALLLDSLLELVGLRPKLAPLFWQQQEDLRQQLPREDAEHRRQNEQEKTGLRTIVGLLMVPVIVFVFVAVLTSNDPNKPVLDPQPQPLQPTSGESKPPALKAKASATPSRVVKVALSDDGSVLASAGDETSVRLWQASGTRELLGHTQNATSVAVSHDGQFVASGSIDGMIRLWRVRDGQLIKSWTGHSDFVFSVGFSLDGNTLFSAGGDRNVNLWSISDRVLIKTMRAPDKADLIVAVSADLRLVGLYRKGGAFNSWYLADDRLVSAFDVNVPPVNCGAFSSDGQVVALGSRYGHVLLWRVIDGQLIKALSRFNMKIISLTFTADGQALAVGLENGAIRLYRVRDGNLIKSLEGHNAPVNSLAFSADGRTLASGSDDKTVRVWNVAER